MKSVKLKNLLIKNLIFVRFDYLVNLFMRLHFFIIHISLVSKYPLLQIIKQGGGSIIIEGNPKNFIFGENAHLKSNTYINTFDLVTIGDYVHIGRGLTIFTSNHNYRSELSIPYDKDYLSGPVTIENFVWLGANVTILPGVRISEGSVVGANSVVTKSVPRCTIVAGNPAKKIGVRDIEVFDKLKFQKKFF